MNLDIIIKVDSLNMVCKYTGWKIMTMNGYGEVTSWKLVEKSKGWQNVTDNSQSRSKLRLVKGK